MSVILETQKSIYTKLSSNATLMLKVKGIYDHVPDNAAYPYITIGEVEAVDNSAKGLKAYNLTANLNVYSQLTGRKEVLEVVEMVRNLLDVQALAITGFNHVMTTLDAIETSIGEDGVTRVGKISLKVKVR